MGKDFRIPEEMERPIYGMNSLQNTELLKQHAGKLLVNSFPGLTSKPRHGFTERYCLSGENEYDMDSTFYYPEAIGYEKEIDGVVNRFIIAWTYRGTVGSNLSHRIVIHNITQNTTQYLDVGTFENNEHVHASFLKLHKAVYIAIERNYTGNSTSIYRTISKILDVNSFGVWSVREIGIDISPSVQGVFSTDVANFGLLGGRSEYASVVWNNQIWLHGGLNGASVHNTLYTTSNGNDWTQQPIEAVEAVVDNDGNQLYNNDGSPLYNEADLFGRYGHKMVVFGNYMYIVGGTDGTSVYDDVWKSADGEVWERQGLVGCGGVSGHGLVVYDGKMWLIGGFDGTSNTEMVWSTEDGLTWSEVTISAGPGARGYHACLVFNNKIWVHGGGADSVYSTEDGATWVQVTAVSGIGDRTGHSIVSYNSAMWCIGGVESGTYKNDVLKSTDGVTWSLIQGSAAFSERADFTSVVFLDEMYVVCGYDGSTWPEDAYHSDDGITWDVVNIGMDAGVYYGYTWTFVRRTDEFAVLGSIGDFIYEAWETVNGALVVGLDETLLTGTISLSGNDLTGVGTAFTTELVVGDFIRIDGEPRCHEVLTITDDDTATVANTLSDTYSDKNFSVLPAVGSAVSTNEYLPAEMEGVEDINMRRVIYAYSTTDYARMMILIPASAEAIAKGATHVRIYRTLQGSSTTVTKGLTYRYLYDVALTENDQQFNDRTHDDSLAGQTNEIEVTGMYVPPAGRFIAWAGGRLWIGGDPSTKGYYFASNLPVNTMYPEKYASLFDKNVDYITCDPDDGQRDTAMFEFLGDLYFCKYRKIFKLVGANLANVPVCVSYHIGVMCPNSVAFGIDPENGFPAVYFISESGPAILTAGGEIRLLHEFAIKELWPNEIGLIKNATEETDWYSRNKVHGCFFADTYWVTWGDSRDPESEFQVNYMYGCHYSDDKSSYGPLKIEIGDAVAFEPQFIVPFSNTLAYCVSHKDSDSAWRHRIVQFLDPGTWYDSYLLDNENTNIHQKWETRPTFAGEYVDSFSVLKRIILRANFSDTAPLSITPYADGSRDSVVNPFSQVRQSGRDGTGHEIYRRSIHFILKTGFRGSQFSILIDKTIPLVASVECPVELFGVEMVISPLNTEAEFQSAGASLTVMTFVENANSVPEVPVV